MDQYLLLTMTEEDQERLREACAEYAKEEVKAGRDEDEAWERAYEMLFRPLLRQTCANDLRMALARVRSTLGPRVIPPVSVRALHHVLTEEIKIRDKSVN